jgi:branched-chain amino acid transport system permease protein
MVGSMYSLLALGFVLVYKATKVFNFAQGEFLMFGAYFGWMCLGPVLGLSVWATFALLVGLMFMLGIGFDRVFMRPMVGQNVLSAIMMTIAIAYMLTGLIILFWGGSSRVYPDIFGEEPLRYVSLSLPQAYLCLFGVSIFMVIILVLFFNYSRLGLSMKATAESHQVSQSMGVDVKKAFATSWGIAAMTAGIGGALLASINGVTVGFTSFGLKVFPVVILGGLESIQGAIIGGLVIGVLEYLTVGYVDPYIKGFHTALPYIILMLILLVKPYGLFGLVRIERI